jgi:hypothetical protein
MANYLKPNENIFLKKIWLIIDGTAQHRSRAQIDFLKKKIICFVIVERNPKLRYLG